MVYVRDDGEVESRGREPRELLAEGGTTPVVAETLISRRAAGPFAAIPVALERDAPLREALARAIVVPSLAAWWRLRIVVLVLAGIPLMMLLELDRELLGKGLAGGARLGIDLVLAGFVAFELGRKTPRVPAVAGAALLAVAMRWLLVIARMCGEGVHWAVWIAATVAVGTALATLAMAPSRRRVALELIGKLGISRGDANAVKAKASTAPSGALAAAALAAAAGLPLLLWGLRRGGTSLWVQASVFVAYAAILPAIVLRRDGTRAADVNHAAARVDVSRTLYAIALGLTLTASLLYGTHHFFDAGGELARCTGRLDEGARRLLAAEAVEVARRATSVRASTALFVMSTCVLPLAEERIYRGLLMKVLARKYGPVYGLFASAMVFGFAHVGVYEIALYQTVLLGVGFGVAYAEGGLLAAFVVHAVWNLMNLA